MIYSFCSKVCEHFKMNWTAGLCVLSWNEAGEGLGKVQINLSPKGGMFNQELWGNPPPQQNRVELKVVAMFDHQRAQRVRVLLVRAFPHRLSHCKKLLWRETFTQTKRGVSPRSSDNIKSNYTWIHFFFLICDSKTKSEDEDAVFVQLSSLMWCWKRCIRSSALWLEFGFSGFRA